MFRVSAARLQDSMARGEVAMWLHRLDPTVTAEAVALPYRRYLDGDVGGAAAEFERLGTPYEWALALTETGDDASARRGLDMLDRGLFPRPVVRRPRAAAMSY